VNFASAFGSQLTELELDDSDPGVTRRLRPRRCPRGRRAGGRDFRELRPSIRPVRWVLLGGRKSGDVHLSRLVDGLSMGRWARAYFVLAFAAFRKP